MMGRCHGGDDHLRIFFREIMAACAETGMVEQRWILGYRTHMQPLAPLGQGGRCDDAPIFVAPRLREEQMANTT